mmetsp:Transcript_2586/g.5164  ORF Transcript_2586/g.5164 Transcript_2586/m.5164 type:complete len:266 (+) Transcript_2586:1370-2167(+)
MVFLLSSLLPSLNRVVLLFHAMASSSASLLLPPKRPPSRPTSFGIDLRPTATGRVVKSTIPVLRTLNEVERFAAWNAAPRAAPSSAFTWTLSGLPAKYSPRIDWIFGMRCAPPIISTESSCSTVSSALASASSIGVVMRARRPAAFSSKVARVICILKSRSSWRLLILTGISVFALSTCLVLSACARSLAMARGCSRTSPLPHCVLNSSAKSSVSTMSKSVPPSSASHDLAFTSKIPIDLFLPFSLPEYALYVAIETCVLAAPIL